MMLVIDIEEAPVAPGHAADFDPARLPADALGSGAAVARAAEVADPSVTTLCADCDDPIGLTDEGTWLWATLLVTDDGVEAVCEACALDRLGARP